MAPLRDYREWHRSYDDPDSALSWRLAQVRELLSAALDRHPGEVTVVSACAGDGRDVLGVLAERPDRGRVRVTLVEIDTALTDRARVAAADQGLAVDVRTADAGVTDAYAGAVPADVLLLVGIFGNIDFADIERTIRAAPQLCAAGATVLWSRSRDRVDRNDDIRGWFTDTGFTELHYVTHDGVTHDGADRLQPSLGVMRFDGEPQTLDIGRPLFTFVR